jgi:hypothetical protein
MGSSGGNRQSHVLLTRISYVDFCLNAVKAKWYVSSLRYQSVCSGIYLHVSEVILINSIRVGLGGVTAGVLSLCLGACGAPAPAEETGTVGEGWAVSACAAVSPNTTVSGAVDPAIVTAQTYNNCGKAYVVDINNLSASYTGSGAGGGQPARLVANWADTVATDQATCESHGGGIIVYKKVGSTWVDQTGQVGTSGIWHPPGFFQAYCEEPHLQFTGLVAGTTYRIAATMRHDPTTTTRKMSIQNLKEEIIR